MRKHDGDEIRMLLAIVALAVAMALHTSEAIGAHDACRISGQLTLSGVVRSQGTVQLEPQATPQTYFLLELTSPYCGQSMVLVGMRAPLFCPDGFTAMMTGTYMKTYPTDETAFLLNARQLKCEP